MASYSDSLYVHTRGYPIRRNLPHCRTHVGLPVAGPYRRDYRLSKAQRSAVERLHSGMPVSLREDEKQNAFTGGTAPVIPPRTGFNSSNSASMVRTEPAQRLTGGHGDSACGGRHPAVHTYVGSSGLPAGAPGLRPPSGPSARGPVRGPSPEKALVTVASTGAGAAQHNRQNSRAGDVGFTEHNSVPVQHIAARGAGPAPAANRFSAAPDPHCTQHGAAPRDHWSPSPDDNVLERALRLPSTAPTQPPPARGAHDGAAHLAGARNTSAVSPVPAASGSPPRPYQVGPTVSAAYPPASAPVVQQAYLNPYVMSGPGAVPPRPQASQVSGPGAVPPRPQASQVSGPGAVPPRPQASQVHNTAHHGHDYLILDGPSDRPDRPSAAAASGGATPARALNARSTGVHLVDSPPTLSSDVVMGPTQSLQSSAKVISSWESAGFFHTRHRSREPMLGKSERSITPPSPSVSSTVHYHHDLQGRPSVAASELYGRPSVAASELYGRPKWPFDTTLDPTGSVHPSSLKDEDGLDDSNDTAPSVDVDDDGVGPAPAPPRHDGGDARLRSQSMHSVLSAVELDITPPGPIGDATVGRVREDSSINWKTDLGTSSQHQPEVKRFSRAERVRPQHANQAPPPSQGPSQVHAKENDKIGRSTKKPSKQSGAPFAARPPRVDLLMSDPSAQDSRTSGVERSSSGLRRAAVRLDRTRAHSHHGVAKVKNEPPSAAPRRGRQRVPQHSRPQTETVTPPSTPPRGTHMDTPPELPSDVDFDTSGYVPSSEAVWNLFDKVSSEVENRWGMSGAPGRPQGRRARSKNSGGGSGGAPAQSSVVPPPAPSSHVLGARKLETDDHFSSSDEALHLVLPPQAQPCSRADSHLTSESAVAAAPAGTYIPGTRQSQASRKQPSAGHVDNATAPQPEGWRIPASPAKPGFGGAHAYLFGSEDTGLRRGVSTGTLYQNDSEPPASPLAAMRDKSPIGTPSQPQPQPSAITRVLPPVPPKQAAKPAPWGASYNDSTGFEGGYSGAGGTASLGYAPGPYPFAMGHVYSDPFQAARRGELPPFGVSGYSGAHLNGLSLSAGFPNVYSHGSHHSHSHHGAGHAMMGVSDLSAGGHSAWGYHGAFSGAGAGGFGASFGQCGHMHYGGYY